ncbi:MAG: endolytic transglycosylase MltG [Betaproteobacteria bacterium]|nr:endolytic transglycosylase MltG [Betaproteobacteria bacterium]
MTRLLRLIVLLTLPLFIWLGLFYQFPLSISSDNAIYELKSGQSLKGIAKDLTKKKIIWEPYTFVFIGKLLGFQTRIKAGSYEFKEGISAFQLLTKISRGDAIDYEVKIIDGMNFNQLKLELDHNPNLSHQLDHLTLPEIKKQLNLEEDSLEGVFYPDTYFFNRGDSDLKILKRAKNNMDAHLNKLWLTRSSNTALTSPYQALILASLVEKETASIAEQPKIAAVFLNRLKIGMRLQTDPTVIFGLGSHYSGRLHHHDLTVDNPYNTYTRNGLPPTPIAYPSLTAINAVLHPESNTDLYFVSKGDGTHYFSKTLAEHNQAVIQYQIHKSH